MLQKLKLFYWGIFFPKKLKDYQELEKAADGCRTCAYRFSTVAIKMGLAETATTRVVCKFDKSINVPSHICKHFKKE